MPFTATAWWRRWAGSAVARLYLTVAAVSRLGAAYRDWHLLGGLSRRRVGGNPDDIRLFAWYLPARSLGGDARSQPAVLHDTMNAPAGVNGMWNTSLLLPALLMAPVTALAGPLAAYNLLFVVGLAAGAGLRLAAVPGGSPATAGPQALGAVLFGFSPAVLAAGLGHINLVLTELMPVMFVLIYDLAAGRREVLTGGAVLGLAAAGQLFTSEEILFQTGLAAVVAGTIVIVTRPRAVSAAALARVARGVGVALCVFVAVCAGPLWLQFWGPLHQHGSPFTMSFYEADLRGFYVPSHMFWLSTRADSAFAASYGGGPAEYMAYLGAPLILTALLVGVARIADRNARMLLGTGLVFAVFSLGGTALADGHQTGVHLPWGAVESWPVFGSALPDRFALIVGLAATGLLAMGLDWLLAADWNAGLFLGLALAAACVVPLVPRPYSTAAAPAVPRFFTDTQRWVPAGSTVLVLPYPTGAQTLPLAWQAAADMAFQMPGGYFIGPAAGGAAYVGGPGPLPVAATLTHIEQGTAAPVIMTGSCVPSSRRSLAYWRATVIVAGPGARAALTAFVTGLMQLQPSTPGWPAASSSGGGDSPGSTHHAEHRFM